MRTPTWSCPPGTWTRSGRRCPAGTCGRTSTAPSGRCSPGIPGRPECHQVWVRRDARSPWRLEFLVDRASTAEEWVFKRDHSVRVPWDRALHQLGGVTYLRPELALLFKAGQDREKDREDLAAARLTP